MIGSQISIIVLNAWRVVTFAKGKKNCKPYNMVVMGSYNEFKFLFYQTELIVDRITMNLPSGSRIELYLYSGCVPNYN